MQRKDDMQTSALIAILILIALAGCVTAPKPAPAVPPTPIKTNAAITVPALPQRSLVRAAIVSQVIAAPATNKILAWDAETNSDAEGYVIYGGNQNGVYNMRIVVPGLTNTQTGIYENPTRYYVWAAAAYVTMTGDPEVTCFTNHDGAVRCSTNTLIESSLSSEISDYSSNLAPFITLTASNAVLMGYGTSNRTYSVTAGASLDSLTPLTSFQGSNALYSIADTLASGSRFYKVVSK